MGRLKAKMKSGARSSKNFNKINIRNTVHYQIKLIKMYVYYLGHKFIVNSTISLESSKILLANRIEGPLFCTKASSVKVIWLWAKLETELIWLYMLFTCDQVQCN